MATSFKQSVDSSLVALSSTVKFSTSAKLPTTLTALCAPERDLEQTRRPKRVCQTQFLRKRTMALSFLVFHSMRDAALVNDSLINLVCTGELAHHLILQSKAHRP